jgi:hypothetical protein
VIDDVVQGGREPVALGRIERRPDAAGPVQAVDEVVRDPIALLLTEA